MYHVEIRQFPHAAHAFNLNREELDARFLRPLAEGRRLQYNERQWAPEKVKIAIYEGPQLAVEEIGMGRGWGNVTKGGENVTARLLAEARLQAESPAGLDGLKQAIVERCADGPLSYEQLLAMAAELAVGADANQTVALAARAVWELLQEDRLSVVAAP
jgi:hypothetical protein